MRVVLLHALIAGNILAAMLGLALAAQRSSSIAILLGIALVWSGASTALVLISTQRYIGISSDISRLLTGAASIGCLVILFFSAFLLLRDPPSSVVWTALFLALAAVVDLAAVFVVSRTPVGGSS